MFLRDYGQSRVLGIDYSAGAGSFISTSPNNEDLNAVLAQVLKHWSREVLCITRESSVMSRLCGLSPGCKFSCECSGFRSGVGWGFSSGIWRGAIGHADPSVMRHRSAPPLEDRSVISPSNKVVNISAYIIMYVIATRSVNYACDMTSSVSKD